MEAFKIKKHIESETLVLPVSKEMIGKNVEIIFLVESEGQAGKNSDTSLDGFYGRWRDERSADEILSEIYAGRDENLRSEKVEL